MRQLLLSALLATALGCASTAPADPRVDALFEPLVADDSPGYAVLVVRDGEVVHQAGYGLADLERGIPMSPSTSVRLGSVGKQFTAMTVLVLIDRGVVDLDAPITTWVPEVTERYGHGITVRHLLNHTGGLPDYYDVLDEHFEEDAMPTNAQVATIYRSWGEADFAPGERYRYSNPGYELLALIAERAAGEPFPDLAEANVLRPIGMDRSLVLDTPGEHFEGRAYGYRPNEEGGFRENDDHMGNLLFGAGGFYATVEDLVAWDEALHTDALISPALLEEAFSPATLNDGTASDYGFGWSVAEDRGQKVVRHGGSWVGFRTSISRYLDDRLTVAVLSNRGDSRPGRLVDQIVALYLGEVAEDAEGAPAPR